MNDKEVNNKTTKRFENSRYVECRWESVEVGDVLKVQKNEVLPADLLIFQTSGEEGICYIETSNLDGERNLKPKQNVKLIHDAILSQGSHAELQGKIYYEKPNNRIYSFRGQVKLSSQSEAMGLQNEHVALRVHSSP